MVRQVFVDFNRVGNARRFRVPLSAAERDGLSVGDVVLVAGDGVVPRRAVVVELAGGDAVLAFNTGALQDPAVVPGS